jgi:hypothetical protein
MAKETRLRTLTALVMLIGIIMVNSILVLRGVAGGIVLANYLIFAVFLVGALRFQRQLSVLGTAGLLSVPYVLAALVASLGG